MNEQNDVSEPASAPVPEPARGRGHHELVPKFHFKRLGRELAMQFLFECDIAGTDDLAENLENFWTQAEHSGEFPNSRIFRKARAYAEKIISGVCENESSIDSLISETSDKWDISRMSAVDRNIIRVAVFELFHCPDIPALVSINEAIEIAKDYSSSKSGNFINGLLNTIKDKIPPHAKNPVPNKTGRKEEP